MESLKLVQECNAVKLSEKHSKKNSIKKDDDLIGLFPLPTYFQIHFQHVHGINHDLQSELAQLKSYVVKVDEKLERLMALLSPSAESML